MLQEIVFDFEIESLEKTSVVVVAEARSFCQTTVAAEGEFLSLCTSLGISAACSAFLFRCSTGTQRLSWYTQRKTSVFVSVGLGLQS